MPTSKTGINDIKSSLLEIITFHYSVVAIDENHIRAKHYGQMNDF